PRDRPRSGAGSRRLEIPRPGTRTDSSAWPPRGGAAEEVVQLAIVDLARPFAETRGDERLPDRVVGLRVVLVLDGGPLLPAEREVPGSRRVEPAGKAVTEQGGEIFCGVVERGDNRGFQRQVIPTLVRANRIVRGAGLEFEPERDVPVRPG